MKKRILLKTISEGAAYGVIAAVIVLFIGFLLTLFVKEELFPLFYYTIGFPVYISTVFGYDKGCQELGCLPIIILGTICIYTLIGITFNLIIRKFKK